MEDQNGSAHVLQVPEASELSLSLDKHETGMSIHWSPKNTLSPSLGPDGT